MIWMLRLDESNAHTLGFVFGDAEEERQFKTLIATKLYEAARNESFEKSVNQNERDWVLNANDVHEDTDGDSGDGQGDDDDMEFDSDEDDEKGQVMVTPPRASRTASQRAAADEKNSQLAVGMGSDRYE